MQDIDNMTAEDISLTAEVKKERLTDHYRMLAWLIYNGAALTGVAVNDPRRFPTLEEAFPSLFEKKEQQDWWIIKQRVEDWAKAKKENR